MSNQIVLECQNVCKIYQDARQDICVLNHINLAIAKGEKVAILGLSGSGKTTLLNLLGGLDSPTKGSVFLMGKPFNSLSANQRALMRNQHLGFIYQLHHLLPEFTALENVMMPLMLKKNIRTKQAKVMAMEMLEKVNLSERYDHKPATLSGGERQRVAIARALVGSPSCVLADEPTGNLDGQRADVVFKLMCDLSDQVGTSFIVVTHDEALAMRMDRVFRIHDGVLSSVERDRS